MDIQKKVTVVITTYRRYERLNLVIQKWSALPEVDEVILMNGGEFFNTGQEIKQVYFVPDFGNKSRFLGAAMAENDFVIMADDDVIPKPGLVQDFLKAYEKKGYGIYGIIGRKPDNEDYFKATFIRADKLEEIEPVAFCGVVYFAKKKHTQFELRFLTQRAIDDLTWQLGFFPNLKKYVIASKNYENLFPECNDEGAIFKTQFDRQIRQNYWKVMMEELI